MIQALYKEEIQPPSDLENEIQVVLVSEEEPTKQNVVMASKLIQKKEYMQALLIIENLLVSG